jgi:hypothetical protein
MENVNYVLGAIGHLLLWISSALVIEELTFAGLARLILSFLSESSSRQSKKKGAARS